MKKHSIILKILILILGLVFIYSSIELRESTSEMMSWKAIKFQFNNFSKTIGSVLLVVIAFYFYLTRKRH